MKSKFLFLFIIFLSAFLRLYKIDKFPPSLYWEETALGYDAYSILKTGKDHHGNFMPLLAFESFGDWKPSLYFYSVVPFISVLGLSDLAVRLPAAISGIAIVIGIGVLIYQILDRKKASKFSLLAMTIAAISPWAIQFSRTAWEVNLATALILWGVVLFIQLIKTNAKKSIECWVLLMSSVFLLCLSMYAYHAARIISPLLGLGLVILWLFDNKKTYTNIKQNFNKILIALFLSLFLVSPIIANLNSPKLNQRFKETSIFYNLDIIKESNARIELAQYSLTSRIFYHRYVLFSREILKNIFSYFDLDFLFLNGDQNPRHSIQYFGTFYHIEFLFLLFGLFYLFKNWNKYYSFLIFWLFISLIPASLSKTNPHALRILPSLPVWILFITLGIYQLISSLQQISQNKFFKKIIFIIASVIIFLAYLFEFGAFWRYYSRVYPTRWGSEWQYGYKELVNKINDYKNTNPESTIYITREQGRPAMYYWFYTKTDPQLVQAAEKTAKKDQGEFLEFENIKFENPPQQVNSSVSVASSLDFQKKYCGEIISKQCKILNEIKDLKDKVVWVIYELK